MLSRYLQTSRLKVKAWEAVGISEGTMLLHELHSTHLLAAGEQTEVVLSEPVRKECQGTACIACHSTTLLYCLEVSPIASPRSLLKFPLETSKAGKVLAFQREVKHDLTF